MSLGIDGGFAQGLGNVLVGAGLVAAEVQQGVRVAGDGFPGVLELLLDLRHVLDDGAAGDVSGPHGCQFAGQPRQIDRGRLIQDEVDMPGQRTVVDLVCTVVKGLEHLGIKQTYQKVIGIVSGKGGVGKSTTAINLSSCLGEMGQKVLTIDMDPQGNTTSGMGVEKNEVENTIYELLLGESKLEDCIIPLNFDNLSLIPSNVNLAGAEIELIGVEDKEFILKNAIDQVRDQYDFIIIDCPPSLNMLTINAMTTADTVLVPIQCEYYALEGLSQLMHTIELVQERLNPELEMEGVVFTMYDARTNLSLQVVENVKDSLDQNIYKTIIPRNVRLAEAPSYGMPINYYDKRSTGAESYRLLADEVIHRGDEE